MCVNNLSKVALDNAAAGIEPAISSRKSNALTTTPPSHAHFFSSVMNLNTDALLYGPTFCSSARL